MSSSSSFTSSWRRCKAGTDHVATWLIKTANMLGFDTSDYVQGRPQQDGAHLGHKSCQQKSVIVKTKYFNDLARLIAKTPGVEIPHALIQTLKSAISVRQESNVHYRRCEPADIPSHESHSHMILVLQSILAVLNSKASQTPKTPEKPLEKNCKIRMITKDVLVNPFSKLQVEQTRDPDASVPDPSIIHKTATSHTESRPSDDDADEVVYGAENVAPGAEENLAIWCLFSDAATLHGLVSFNLEDYGRESITFSAAAAAADYAIRVLQDLEDDFRSEFPLVNFERLQCTAHFMYCRQHHHAPNDNDELPINKPLDHTPYDDCQRWSFTAASLRLDTCRSILAQKGVRIPCRHHNSATELRLPASGSDIDRLAAESHVLRDFFQFVLMLERVGWCLPWENSVMKTLRHYIRTGERSLTLLFGLECYIDFHRTLQGMQRQPFDELVPVATDARRALLEHAASFQDRGASGWAGSTEEYFRQFIVIRVDNFILANGLYSGMLALVLKDDIEGRAGLAPPFYFLKRHPLLCGIIMLDLQNHIIRAGFKSAVTTSITEMVAHLYNAVNSERQKDPHGPGLHGWKSMDRFLLLHGKQVFASASRPDDSQAYWFRLVMASGISVSTFAANRRKTVRSTAEVSARGRTKLDYPCPVLVEYLAYLYRPDDIEGDRNMRRVLHGPCAKVRQTLKERYDVRSQPAGGHTQVAIMRRIKACKGARSLTLPEELNAFTIAVAQETSALGFDYMALQRECWEVVDKLSALPDCRKVMTMMAVLRDVAPIELPDGAVVLSIIEEVAPEDKCAMLAGKWRRGNQSTSKLMKKVVRWMENWLKVRGMKEEKACKGKQ